MKSTRIRRLRLAALFVGVLVVALGGGAGASLPPQANDEAHAHATHGPDGLALDKRGHRPGPVVAGYSVDNHAQWRSCEYDRASLLADYVLQTVGQTETLPQVHAVYVYPAKTTSRFLQFAAMFQADARQSSVLLQTLGRDVRWDLRPADVSQAPAPEFCGGPTLLDITVFQSKYTAQQLSSPRQFSLVATELAKSGKFSALNKKYVVWLDANSQYCGQGTLWQDTNRSSLTDSEVNRTTGIVYRPYAASDGLTGGFCRGRTLLHELGHNLGALQSGAPNAFDGAHCDDDNNDTMCYTGVATDQVSSPDAQFDYRKNDYWDPGASKPTTQNPDGSPTTSAEALTWWAVNLSQYICPLPPEATAATPADCSRFNSNPGY
jgi:hypothetical protein